MSKTHELASNTRQNVRKREINVRHVRAGQRPKTCSKRLNLTFSRFPIPQVLRLLIKKNI